MSQKHVSAMSISKQLVTIAINLGRARCAARLKDGGIKEQERKDAQEEDRSERGERRFIF